MKHPYLLLVLLLAVSVRPAVWEAHLPGGGLATAVTTTWGASVSYDSYPDAVSTSITGRTAYTVTTRSADAPLSLSLVNNENWPWETALNHHWVSFSAVGIDGVTRQAEFYNRSDPGPRPDAIVAMYSAATADSHVAVPEPAGAALAFAFVVPFAACVLRHGLVRKQHGSTRAGPRQR
jgi:hypothetical protein